MRTGGVTHWWSDYRGLYSPDFRDFVDGQIREAEAAGRASLESRYNSGGDLKMTGSASVADQILDFCQALGQILRHL